MDKLRVQMVLNSLAIGGAERHSTELAAELFALGDEVNLVYLSPRHDLLGVLPEALQSRAVCIERTSGMDVVAARGLAQLRKRADPDVVLTVNQFPQVVHSLSRLFGRSTPVAAVQHSMASPSDSPFRLGVARAALRAADALVYLSPVQQAYWRMRGVSAGREEIIPNGVDLQRFRPADPLQRIRSRSSIGASARDLVIGVCAGLRAEKRHETLLHAAGRLLGEGLSLKLVFIGDGPRREALEVLAASLGLGDRLRITGYVERVEDWLAACDIACLSSTHETQPLALIEAQAMGLPAVASRVGANQDIVTEGRDGYLFDVNDIGGLADCVRKLADSSRRAGFGAAARRHAEASFDRRRMVSAYRSLLVDLAAQRRRTAA
jgi:glycosyltransferase involved in cell wall biosynthesis